MDRNPILGISNTLPSSWWLEDWRTNISAILAILIFLCGIITVFSLSWTCIFSGFLLIVAAIFILAAETPGTVSYIKFTQPVGRFFEDKSHWVRCVFYLIVSIVPLLFGCYGLFAIVGFIASISVSGIYFLLCIGNRPPRPEMSFRAPTEETPIIVPAYKQPHSIPSSVIQIKSN